MMLGAITLLIIREGFFLGVLGTPGHHRLLREVSPPKGTQLLKTEQIIQSVQLYGNYGWSKDSDFVP